MKSWVCGLLICVVMCSGLPLYASPSISSQSAIVYLPETGQVLFEKDADTRRPMASTTKLMTALLAAESLSPDEDIVVPQEAVLVEGSSLGLRGGDHISVQDLLTGMLLESGNDAANAVALSMEDSLADFARRMNARAAQLGMTNSLFVTPSGLDSGGHGACARDMALLGAAVLESPLLATICATKSTRITFGNPPTVHTVTNHNRLLSKMDDCVGLKTGYTTKAGRCLVSAVTRNDITLVTVTLNGHNYWDDHQTLYDYGYAQVMRVELPTVTLTPLTVSGGTADTVPLCVEAIPDPIVDAGAPMTVTAVVELPSFVVSPVEKGQCVGYVRYQNGTDVLSRAPIVAAQSVEAQPPASAWVWWWRWFCALLSV